MRKELPLTVPPINGCYDEYGNRTFAWMKIFAGDYKQS